LRLSGVLALAAATPCLAQYDPSKMPAQAPEVAARFPEPAIEYRTPSFAPGRADFTSHAELAAYLEGLAADSKQARLVKIGTSQQNRAIHALVLADGANTLTAIRSNGRPIVLIIGLQHGNEPAGGEGALVIADRLARGDLAPLLNRINVLIVPRANPDGAEAFKRELADGTDANRDHTLLRTPEIKGLTRLVLDYEPDVVLDLHEFTVGGRWIQGFGGLASADVLIQYATTSNLSRTLYDAQENLFRRPVVAALEKASLKADWYHTSDPRAPKIVNMGGILPDTGRNVSGLRNSISFLFETRGVGIGRTNWKRRVYAHSIAVETILRNAAEKGPELKALISAARSRDPAVESQEIVVLAEQTMTERPMVFIDPKTGEERPLTVQWRSALDIRPKLTRPRPAGYLLPPGAEAAAQRLAELGIIVVRLDDATRLAAERYRTLEVDLGEKQDVRGSGGAPKILIGKFDTETVDADVAAGSYFVSLAQPLGALAAMVLEPESTVGYVAHGVLPLGADKSVPLLRAKAVPQVPAQQVSAAK
jgi:hypothetical protein